MNFNFTLLDSSVDRKGVSKLYNARLAAEKAIFDALLYDNEFRGTAKSLYENGSTDALSRMLRSVVSNEIKMEMSDMLSNTRRRYAIDEDEKPASQWDLPAAIEMIDSGKLEMLSVYKNAEGLLEIMLGILR